MKYLTAHPKIKEMVARSFFTTVQDLDRQMSIAAQTLACSEFFEQSVRTFGGEIVAPLMQFFERYVGTFPQVGTDLRLRAHSIEFCNFMHDGSRDGVRLDINQNLTREGRDIEFTVVRLTGVFGVTTETTIQEMLL